MPTNLIVPCGCIFILHEMALKTESIKSTQVKFVDEKSSKINESIVSEEIPKKNKHIKFENNEDDDDGGRNTVGNGDGKNGNRTEKKQPTKKSEKNRKNAMDIGTHWYQVVSFFWNRFYNGYNTADTTNPQAKRSVLMVHTFQLLVCSA